MRERRPLAPCRRAARRCAAALLVGACAARPEKFSPYAFNGGSVAAVAGDGFAIVGADAQFLDGSLIRSRGFERICAVSDSACVASAGCEADCTAVQERLADFARSFEAPSSIALTTPQTPGLSAASCAQVLSRILYSRRAMPFYVRAPPLPLLSRQNHKRDLPRGRDDGGLLRRPRTSSPGSTRAAGAWPTPSTPWAPFRRASRSRRARPKP